MAVLLMFIQLFWSRTPEYRHSAFLHANPKKIKRALKKKKKKGGAVCLKIFHSVYKPKT
jgi:hypothetical protein